MKNSIQIKAADTLKAAHGYSASVVRLRNTSAVSIDYSVSGGSAVELAAGASAIVDVAGLTSEIAVRRTDLSATPANVLLEFGLTADEAYEQSTAAAAATTAAHDAEPDAHGLTAVTERTFAAVPNQSAVLNGYYQADTGAWVASPTEWRTIEFPVVAGITYYATGGVRPVITALAVYLGSSGELLGSHAIGPNVLAVVCYTRVKLSPPVGTAKIAVVALFPSVPVCEQAVDTQTNQIVEKSTISPWKGKRVWWCGTSIPAGSGVQKYPEKVAALLECTVLNESLGGSMCRRSTRTGDYAGAVWTNLSGCLSKTQAEAEGIITNWATIRPTLSDGGSYTDTMSTADKNRVRLSSFERRLLPYLNGTLEMPDVFVFDHGHNDYKYKLADGTTSDLDLAPTAANISAGTLADDTTMTASSNAILETFMGSLANVEAAKRAEFIASLNRNCFRGAINFLCTLILKWNPRARIVFISEYEHSTAYSIVSETQQTVADEWNRPLVRVDQKLGISQRIIPGTRAYWGGSGYDLTELAINCPDTVHPHSDTTGLTTDRYAWVIASELRKIL